MLVLAGAPLGLRFAIFDTVADACAGELAPLTVGSYADAEALATFADGIAVATFDFENVPAQAAETLTTHTFVAPNARALAVAQDRLSEKTLFRELGIPVPPFAAIETREQLAAAVAELGTPCILKTRRLGYDGKGQFRIKSPTDVEPAWVALGEQAGKVGLILEGFVAFQRELSVVGVRGRDGEFRAWPLTQNWHVDGVLSASLAPARVDETTQATALAVPGLHWHDYGKQPRTGRKVGHATLRADLPQALAEALRQAGEALGRQTQVAPVVEVLAASV